MHCRSETFRLERKFITSSFGPVKADRWFARRAALHRSLRRKAITHSFACPRVRFAKFLWFATQLSAKSATPSMRTFRLAKPDATVGRENDRRFAALQ